MDIVPNDIKYTILLELSFHDIMQLCSVNQDFNNICNNFDFWVYKINYDFYTNFSKSELLNFNTQQWQSEYYDINFSLDPKVFDTSFHAKIEQLYKILMIINGLVHDKIDYIHKHEDIYIDLMKNEVYLPAEIKSNIHITPGNHDIEIAYNDDYVIYYPIDDDLYNNKIYNSNFDEIYLMLFRVLFLNPDGIDYIEYDDNY